MTRSTRTLLLSCAAVVAALSLALGPVAAEDDEDAGAMASMAPMAEMASVAPMPSMAPGLHVMHAWARPSPMMDLAGAAYMTIDNDSDVDDALVGASSPAAAAVELHLSSMDEEGMMSMQPVSEVALPAQAEAELKPGSYHLMLIDLVEPLELDSELEITLEFMTAEPQTVTVPVLAEAPMMDGMDMGDMHGMDNGMDDDADDHDDGEGEEDED